MRREPGEVPAEDDDGPTFDEPWQARAFALAVALTDEDTRGWTWTEFQRELVREVEADPGPAAGTDRAYYRQWLRALERFLLDRGAVDPDDVLDRAAAFAAGERDAHEFVTGDPHDHADRLPEGHARGSHHHHGDGDDHGHDDGPADAPDHQH